MDLVKALLEILISGFTCFGVRWDMNAGHALRHRGGEHPCGLQIPVSEGFLDPSNGSVIANNDLDN